ncbi:glycosyltransferase [Candidatus Saccharibacteria bacterium]|nr:glycosyltransferase [Candidatus Saccharibacteria bacterium]
MFDVSVFKDLLLYVPLSIIGLWRWSFWLVKRFAATTYHPNVRPWPKNQPRPTVSIVTPVYNEDPIVFEQALQSWRKNGVEEVIAVIDKSNTNHIVNFTRTYVNAEPSKTKFRLIVTPKPGKRAALCDGIDKASGDLIALVDSDTIWDDNVLEKTIPYFKNPRIGGATVSQRISNPDTAANILFDILLWTRYKEEVPFLLGVGMALNTLSGRTAIYRREAILNIDYDNLHQLRHEFFMGTRGISGDDKRLTHLILQQGWHTAFVLGATVYTPGLDSLRVFFKQRLRWTRNSWRADLRAVGKGWVWMHPALAIFMIDRFFQPLFMLIGPVVLVLAVVHQEWLFAGILIAWWLVSRFIRIFGYFRSHPKRLVYLPVYIVYGYVNALFKIYALATLLEHSWATRWHKNRAKRKSFIKKSATVLGGYVAIVICTVLLTQLALSFRQQSGANVDIQPPVDVAAFEREAQKLRGLQASPIIIEDGIDPTEVKTYIVQQGDTMQALSTSLGMSVGDLKRLNSIADSDNINIGQAIVYHKGPL